MGKSLHRRCTEARSLQTQLAKHGLTAARGDMQEIFAALAQFKSRHPRDWSAEVDLYDSDQKLVVRLYATGNKWSEAEMWDNS